jgi:SPP1 family predicted phage head-tail adaptor
LVEIGYTENAVNDNGYPEPKDVVVCKAWASVVDAGNQHYRAADVMNTEQVINFTIRYRSDIKPGMWVRFGVKSGTSPRWASIRSSVPTLA